MSLFCLIFVPLINFFINYTKLIEYHNKFKQKKGFNKGNINIWTGEFLY